jgi:hypothetical protein
MVGEEGVIDIGSQLGYTTMLYGEILMWVI